MTALQNDTNLVWIDLEMTGLDPKTHRIIEIATIITDSDLNILEEGPTLAIHQPPFELDKMDDWNVRHHNASGLVQRVQASTYDERKAELATLDFIQPWVAKGKSPLCGNTICQDRRFLVETMPELADYFHYRNLDVSTVKQLCQRWAPNIAQQFVKTSTHEALQDIRDSISELRFYKTHWLNQT